MTHVAVIGGGHNGLIAATYLARAGLRVTVLERSGELGGLAATTEVAPGYRAPRFLHTVEGLRRSVVEDLGLGDAGLRLLRPEVSAVALDPEGGGVVLHHEAARTAEDLSSRSPRDAAVFPSYDRRIRSIASFVAHVAAAVPPDVEAPSLSDGLAALKLGRSLRKLGPRAMRETLRVLPMAVADLVGEDFDDQLVQAALASRGVRLTAMGPWTAGTAATFLLASVTGGGAAGATVYAEGGTGSLAAALEKVARSSGVEIRTEADVTEVRVEGTRATGVVLGSGEEIPARAVVSTVDPKRTLRMVDPVVLGPNMVWRGRNIRAPGSVAKVNLALERLPEFKGISGTEHLTGRILVGPSIAHLERAADDRKYGRTAEDPFLEVTVPSLTDPSLAPDGGHVASVLVHFVPDEPREGPWDDAGRDDLGDLVERTLDGYAPGFGDAVAGRQVLVPPDLQAELGMTGGCIQHAEPGLDQFFAWRPLLGHARYRFVVPGLYLAGSGAHPGGGITGAPGANAARVIAADLAG